MKKRKQRNPEISTASLPDIIFMLLFFFMVVTVLRKDVSSLFYKIPDVNELTKLETPDEQAYLYIGKSKRDKEVYEIQINDMMIDVNRLEETFRKLTSSTEVDINTFEVYMKADKYVPMKLIRDVKLSMRKSGIRHLVYLTEVKA